MTTGQLRPQFICYGPLGVVPHLGGRTRKFENWTNGNLKPEIAKLQIGPGAHRSNDRLGSDR